VGATDRNWWDVPYHFLLDIDGRIFEGRDYHYMGETNTSYDPGGHFLISAIGNYERQEPTPATLAAIADLMAWALKEFDLPLDRIGGHYNYAKTGCPGEHLRKYLEDGTLRRMVAERLRWTERDEPVMRMRALILLAGLVLGGLGFERGTHSAGRILLRGLPLQLGRSELLRLTVFPRQSALRWARHLRANQVSRRLRMRGRRSGWSHDYPRTDSHFVRILRELSTIRPSSSRGQSSAACSFAWTSRRSFPTRSPISRSPADGT
jgi:hypothetical protein